MRRIAILAAFGAFLAGCAPDIYDKAGGTQEGFNADLGGCQMFALSIPGVQAAYIPPSYTSTTTANASYMGTPNYGTVNGMATTTTTPDNSGQAMANLGAAIGTQMRQRDAMHACMASKGYTLRH